MSKSGSNPWSIRSAHSEEGKSENNEIEKDVDEENSGEREESEEGEILEKVGQMKHGEL